MNIFWLDYDIKENVKMYVDKHVVKMIVEYAQLLNTSYYYTDELEKSYYKLSHYNHPCAIWARYSVDNWLLLRQLGVSLYEEYQYRYGKLHKSGEILLDCKIPNLGEFGLTLPPLCMPDDCKCEDVVKSYQNYYNKYKSHIFSWTGREIPYFIERGFIDRN